jgi:hypothetical protein
MIAGTDPDLGDGDTGDDRYRLLPFRSPAALEMREWSSWFRAVARQRGDDARPAHPGRRQGRRLVHLR